jgi:hypothetical protein
MQRFASTSGDFLCRVFGARPMLSGSAWHYSGSNTKARCFALHDTQSEIVQCSVGLSPTNARKRSTCPRFLAASDSFSYLGLKRRRSESEPFLVHLIDQQPLFFRAELHQPVQRFLPGAVSSRDHHVDRQAMPDEIGRQHDHVGFVRTHPFRQRAGGDQPAANEFAAWVLRAFAVNRTLMVNAVRARLAAPHLMPAYFDLQPAIAACRATPAGSLVLLVQRPKPIGEA